MNRSRLGFIIFSIASGIALSFAAAPSYSKGKNILAPLYLAQSEQTPAESETPAEKKPFNEQDTSEGNSKDLSEPLAGDKSEDVADKDKGQKVASDSAEGFDNDAYPEVMRDLEKLPFPVRRMRELIMEAARSGDVEKLRPLIGYGDDLTMLSLGGIDEDPITFLKLLSGDEQGHEILAILTEVLESGYVHMDAGSEQELYVWPYFFAWPLDKLSDAQKVELYRIVTHGDFEDMQSFGAYIFYRVGITPRGRWRFFVAGD